MFKLSSSPCFNCQGNDIIVEMKSKENKTEKIKKLIQWHLTGFGFNTKM